MQPPGEDPHSVARLPLGTADETAREDVVMMTREARLRVLRIGQGRRRWDVDFKRLARGGDQD